MRVVELGYRSHDVFGWLDEVREHRSMWVGSGGVRELELLDHGYDTARRLHHIDEGVPSMLHFPEWVRLRESWSLSCGWAVAIEEHASATGIRSMSSSSLSTSIEGCAPPSFATPCSDPIRSQPASA